MSMDCTSNNSWTIRVRILLIFLKFLTNYSRKEL